MLMATVMSMAYVTRATALILPSQVVPCLVNVSFLVSRDYFPANTFVLSLTIVQLIGLELLGSTMPERCCGEIRIKYSDLE